MSKRRPYSSRPSLDYYSIHNNNNNNNNNSRIISRQRQSCISLSKDETILLSSCGDVVSCRCRESPYPNSVVDNPLVLLKNKKNHMNSGNGERDSWNGYEWEPLVEQIAVMCCEVDGLSNNSNNSLHHPLSSTLCGISTNNVWLGGDEPTTTPTPSCPIQLEIPITKGGRNAVSTPPRTTGMSNASTTMSNTSRLRGGGGGGGGLLGGSPADVASPLLHHQSQPHTQHHHNPQHHHNHHHHHTPSSPPSYFREATTTAPETATPEQQPALPPLNAAQAFRNLNLQNHHHDDNISALTPPTHAGAAVEDDENDDDNSSSSDIVQIRSFDYSHFFGVDNGNDMLPDTPKREKEKGGGGRGGAMSTNNNDTTTARTNVVISPSSLLSRSSLDHPMITTSTNTTNNKNMRTDYSAEMMNGPSSTPQQQQENQHAHPDNNDSWHQQEQQQQQPQQQQDSFFHGIPTFLRSFASVRITRLSAHPLGSHVLLISSAGLLYSYGLNHEGQLGIGVKTSATSGSYNCGYITTPTIVTPLVENGGKAIACAAGVNHSLVVVETEERRLVKSRSFEPAPPVYVPSSPSSLVPPLQSSSSTKSAASSVSAQSLDRAMLTVTEQRNNSNNHHHHCNGNGVNGAGARGNHRYRHYTFSNGGTETVVHHQVYGFGRNDSLKIGLISPKVALINGMEESVESVVLPRRVALRCRAQQLYNDEHYCYENTNDQYNASSSLPPLGIFDIQASAEHSAALVHRNSGQIELYTWGNAAFGALGSMPGQSIRSPEVPVNVVPVPSFVASLSLSDNSEAQASSLLLEGEYPMSCSLGRQSSFVLTSFGRCFSFGTSDEGMLGLGPKIAEASRPSEIALPAELRGEGLTSVSAGASHVVACTESGRVLAWGSKVPCGFALPASQNNNNSDSSHSVQWSPKQVEFLVTGNHKSSSSNNNNKLLLSSTKNRTQPQDYKIAHVGAGYDCSVFVTESGRVFSCGRYSGRLGLGELNSSLLQRTSTTTTDGKGKNNNNANGATDTGGGQVVSSPRPLLGGLRLWQEQHEAAPLHHHHHTTAATMTTTTTTTTTIPRQTPIMKRGITISS